MHVPNFVAPMEGIPLPLLKQVIHVSNGAQEQI